MNSPSSNQADVGTSKSQRKREAHARRALGERLVELNAEQLDALALPARLREAIAGAKRITQRIARKRELQYVGKLLREVDVAPIEAALSALEQPGIAERQRQHRLERWRDALIDGADPMLARLCAVAPAADRRQLRQLLLEARRERAAQRPPSAARKLFRALRELDASHPLPEEPDAT